MTEEREMTEGEKLCVPVSAERSGADIRWHSSAAKPWHVFTIFVLWVNH